MEELTIREYYLARRYARLWTVAEAQAADAFVFDGKLKKLQGSELAGEIKTALEDQLQARLGNPAVADLVKKGRKRFYRELVERLLRDYSDELPTCPSCRGLLPMDRAMQCFECGYDWHRPRRGSTE